MEKRNKVTEISYMHQVAGPLWHAELQETFVKQGCLIHRYHYRVLVHAQFPPAGIKVLNLGSGNLAWPCATQTTTKKSYDE